MGDGAGVSPDESPLSWFIITEEKMTMGGWPRRKSMVVARGWKLEVRGSGGEGREVVMVMGGGRGGLVLGGGWEVSACTGHADSALTLTAPAALLVGRE